jgi:hypothetical protein
LSNEETGPASRATWSVDRIPYDRLDRSAVTEDMAFFYTVTSASLVEFASAVYADSLAELFADDDEVAGWLAGAWRSEELQHGEALKRYVRAAWPHFDWDEAYRGFVAELAPLYSIDRLAPTRTLEMLARCFVESGTATFYRTLSALAPEPIFRLVTTNIGSDEVRHYKHFYRYFLRYKAIEKPRATALFRMLWARSSEIDAEDLVYAVKHITRVCEPATPWRREGYEAVRNASFRMMRDHYPFRMAAKMLLKPLGVGPLTTRCVTPVAAAAARCFLMR